MSRAACTACVVAVTLAGFQGGGNVHAATRTTPIVVHVDRSGFRLVDAALGAIAGAGAALAGVGCAVLLRLRREEAKQRQRGAPR